VKDGFLIIVIHKKLFSQSFLFSQSYFYEVARTSYRIYYKISLFYSNLHFYNVLIVLDEFYVEVYLAISQFALLTILLLSLNSKILYSAGSVDNYLQLIQASL
jgi:hypothetical protein